MKRLALAFVAAGAVAALAARPASADDHVGKHRGEFAARRLGRCLDSLDLSPELKASIDALRAAAKPSLQAGRDALQADRQKLKSDLDAGADKSVIGQDVITLHADRSKLRADATSLRDQILAKLSVDQRNQLKVCARSPRGRRGAASGEPAS